MIRTIKLEEHEKTAICTVLDMLNQAIEDDELAEALNDCGGYVGITIEDCHALLADIYNTYG